jgi:hypothetical protein
MVAKLLTGFLLGFFDDPEDGGGQFLFIIIIAVRT